MTAQAVPEYSCVLNPFPLNHQLIIFGSLSLLVTDWAGKVGKKRIGISYWDIASIFYQEKDIYIKHPTPK
jgi:hypothetical protein